MSKRDEYLAGVRAGIPVLLGFIPVGIAYAIMARQAGFDIFETCFMSVAVFAGMYAQGAGLAAAGILAWKKSACHGLGTLCDFRGVCFVSGDLKKG